MSEYDMVKSAECRPAVLADDPIKDQLLWKKSRLVTELSQIDAALAMLEKNPEMAAFYDVIRKASWGKLS